MNRIAAKTLFVFCLLSWCTQCLAQEIQSERPVNSKTESKTAKPNFIFFIADDISFDDIGCYGNEFVKTPNLDRMAKEGMVFENAYLTASSCSPSRCSIITGRYPHNTGAPELHSTLPGTQFMFPQALRQSGYYTALSGKNHMGSAVKSAFEKIDNGGGPSGSAKWIQHLKDRPRDKPFFFWFASHDAHRNWAVNDEAPTYKPTQINVPPFLFDGPKTREDLVGYYHEVSRTDHFVGKIMAELKAQGIDDNTYFVYCADNGRPFPRCKTRLYDSGIRTPLIVWSPKWIKPARTQSLVSSIDFAPTFLELAQSKSVESIQGVSFAPILKDFKATTRDYVFAEHNWHVFQAHERMVRFGNWVYIKNAWPELQSRCMESIAHFPAGIELEEKYKTGELAKHQTDCFLAPRPKEELYDLRDDPNQLNNLMDNESAKQTLNHARRVLSKWQDQTADSVPKNPTLDRGKRRKGSNRRWERGEMPGESSGASTTMNQGPVRYSKTSIPNIGLLNENSSAGKSERPNILFIMSDDHTTQAIGAYGSRLAKLNPTPVIDSLAAEGIRFTNCYVTNSICTPSRACIMTGQYPHVNGVLDLGGRIKPKDQHLAREMKNAGYQTAMIGKWHLKEEPAAFDYYQVLPGQGKYYDPEFRIRGDRPWPGNVIQYKGKHSSDAITDIGIDWLKQKWDRDQPFFMMHHFKAPHDMFGNAKRYEEYLADAEIPEPDMESKTVRLDCHSWVQRSVAAFHWDVYRPPEPET